MRGFQVIFSKHEGNVIQCKQTLMILLHLLNCVCWYSNDMIIKKNHKASILIEGRKFKRVKNMELGSQIQCIFGIGLFPICLETSVLLINGRFYFRYNGSNSNTLKSKWETKNGCNNRQYLLITTLHCVLIIISPSQDEYSWPYTKLTVAFESDLIKLIVSSCVLSYT